MAILPTHVYLVYKVYTTLPPSCVTSLINGPLTLFLFSEMSFATVVRSSDFAVLLSCLTVYALITYYCDCSLCAYVPLALAAYQLYEMVVPKKIEGN